MTGKRLILQILAIVCCGTLWVTTEAGIIKDLYQKIAHTNNGTEQIVKESSPICGNGVFSTTNQSSLSPEIVFITNRQSTSFGRDENKRSFERNSHPKEVNEVAKEFRFNVENVTLDELRSRGFNPDAPVTILMHGFTSGYPLQAWISAIVEAYTINRQSPSVVYNEGSGQRGSTKEDRQLSHNLFVINCHYALRGIVYPRAVANLPIVASYVTRFINDKLLDEAGMDSRQIQLIGHSLGAHLAGFIGKNTKSPLSRIYGLDPAGPCFGSISGSLYPANKRLAPSDADEVITIHTNSALLGIETPIGKYSVFVEGGSTQPGCDDGGILHSLSSAVFDGPDFDKISCSHSRAPNLLTFRHEQSDMQDDCQMVAYECKDWDSFKDGHCGVCQSELSSKDSPFKSVDCLRIGLEWQYPSTKRPLEHETSSISSHNNWHHTNHEDYRTSTKRPSLSDQDYAKPPRDNYNFNDGYNGSSSATQSYRRSTLKPSFGSDSSHQRNRRQTSNSSQDISERRGFNDSIKAKSLFLRTSDTQPYCVYHYQVVLELSQPLSKKPPMSLLLQDSKPESHNHSIRQKEQNSLSHDEFGNKFNDMFYTHLMVSSKKLNRIDHATLLFRNGLPEGRRILKALHVNYMSHADQQVRQRLSSRLCPVDTNTGSSQNTGASSPTRFFFEPCNSKPSGSNDKPNYSYRPTLSPNHEQYRNLSYN